MNLDLSRPYAQVYGDPNIKYEQDGRHFNGRGYEIGDPMPPEPRPHPTTVGVAVPRGTPPVNQAPLSNAAVMDAILVLRTKVERIEGKIDEIMEHMLAGTIPISAGVADFVEKNVAPIAIEEPPKRKPGRPKKVRAE